jgi:hypothetical protein
MFTTTTPIPTDFTVRYAHAGDLEAIIRLAQLDSRPVPRGALLVAESGDRILAATPLDGGDPIANPFVRTAQLVEVLRLRVAQLASGPKRVADSWTDRTRQSVPKRYGE